MANLVLCFLSLDPQKELKKQLKKMSNYHRFADSEEGKRALPDELLKTLATAGNKAKMKVAPVPKKKKEERKKEKGKEQKGQETSSAKPRRVKSAPMSSKELESRLRAAEIEIKALRDIVARGEK